MELWSIDKPFDTLLIKYWPEKLLGQLINALSPCNSESEIAEALMPVGIERAEYYKLGVVRKIINNFCDGKSLCTGSKHCQDVYRHYMGMQCCTAAALRKRLYPRFVRHLGLLQDFKLQTSIMQSLKIVPVRQKLGILLIHCPLPDCPRVSADHTDPETSSSNTTLLTNAGPEKYTITNSYHHTLKVLYDNFYLFTAPLNESYANNHRDEVKRFIGNQIFRNSDCIVIMVDDRMIDTWCHNEKMKLLILESLGWDIRIQILIIGVSPDSKDVISNIYECMQKRPWPIFYEQFIMAPSGGLVSLIKRACQLDFKSSIVKYCHRINIALGGFKDLNTL